MTMRFLLTVLAASSGVYSYLLLGPVGLSCYLGMLTLAVLVAPIQRKTAARLAYTAELAAFRRELRIARRLAAQALT